MASLTQWTWVWANSRGQWQIVKPGVQQSVGLINNWVTEQQSSGIIGNSGHTLVAQMVRVCLQWGRPKFDPWVWSLLLHGGAWWAIVHGIAKSWTRLSDFTRSYKYTTLSLHSTSCLSEYLVWKSWENVRCVGGEHLKLNFFKKNLA